MGRTSVFRTQGLDRSSVHGLALDVSGTRSPQLKGYATFAATAVLSIPPLSLEADPSSHPRHANVIGWPDEKAERIGLARELATASEFVET